MKIQLLLFLSFILILNTSCKCKKTSKKIAIKKPVSINNLDFKQFYDTANYIAFLPLNYKEKYFIDKGNYLKIQSEIESYLNLKNPDKLDFYYLRLPVIDSTIKPILLSSFSKSKGRISYLYTLSNDFKVLDKLNILNINKIGKNSYEVDCFNISINYLINVRKIIKKDSIRKVTDRYYKINDSGRFIEVGI